MRRVLYISGTRADFGLMQSTLQQIHSSDQLDLGLFVTGMHLEKAYGETIGQILASGLPIVGQQRVELGSDDPAVMARAISIEIDGILDTVISFAPDIVLLLGDRGEMLAGAIAALHMGIHIVHIHGGELSGTVDEPVRHAISKLAHYHFTATEKARERLIRMGEKSTHIFNLGAPGLDDIVSAPLVCREKWLTSQGFSADKPMALVVFHPVVQLATQAGQQIEQLIAALQSFDDLQVVILRPNADAGGEAIREKLVPLEDQYLIKDHIPRADYLQWLNSVDALVGNSSSGIIEAASYNTPVVNIGERQNGRERSENVIDTGANTEEIVSAINSCLIKRKAEVINVYGNGGTGRKIVEQLQRLSLASDVLMKVNEY